MSKILTFTLPPNETGVEYNCKLNLDNLPQWRNIIGYLRKSKANLYTWIELSMGFANKGDEEGFVNILENSSDCASIEYDGQETDQLEVRGLLSAYYTRKGNIAYEEMKTKEALSFYLKAMGWNSGSSVIRVAIARCYLKLGNVKDALEHCSQVLDINGERIDGLSDIAMELLNKADAIDNKNPVVLNQLANCSFVVKDYKKCLLMAAQALNLTNDQLSNYKSYYTLGKAYHVQENFEKAFKYYLLASKSAPDKCVLSYYGLGQMYMYKGKMENAIRCFEKILKVHPEDISVMKILGVLYTISTSSNPHNTMANTYLNEVTEKCPDDVDSRVRLAQLWEESNLQRSLTAYSRAISLMRSGSKNSCILYKVLNNAAIVHYKLEKFHESRLQFQESISALTKMDNAESEHYKLHKLEITFNLAKVNEDLQELELAKKLYYSIIEQNPNYIKSYLSLGCIAQRSQLFDEAHGWCQKVLKIDNKNIDALMLLGKLQLNKRYFSATLKVFESILQNSSESQNIRALLGKASTYLEAAQNSKLKRQKIKLMITSLNLFLKILHIDPKNFFAINGIGCILGHLDQYLNEAKILFKLVNKDHPIFNDANRNIELIIKQQKRLENDMQEDSIILIEFSKTVPQLMEMITRENPPNQQQQSTSTARQEDCVEHPPKQHQQSTSTARQEDCVEHPPKQHQQSTSTARQEDCVEPSQTKMIRIMKKKMDKFEEMALTSQIVTPMDVDGLSSQNQET